MWSILAELLPEIVKIVLPCHGRPTVTEPVILCQQPKPHNHPPAQPAAQTALLGHPQTFNPQEALSPNSISLITSHRQRIVGV